MNNIIKSKLLLSAFLSSVILLTSVQLSATTLSPAEHKEAIIKFISDLRIIQNRIFQVAQIALDEPPEISRLTSTINSINSDISTLRKQAIDYNSALTPTSLQNTDVLLLQNAINDSQNSLHQLNAVSDTTSNLEKLMLFEKYFIYKNSSDQTLSNIENTISKY